MASKLIVEIDLLNFSATDAVAALIHLADLPSKNPPPLESSPDWLLFEYDGYALRWRFVL